MDITTNAATTLQQSPARDLGPAIAPRSLAEITKTALLIARELHEVHVARFTTVTEDGFYSDSVVQDARANVEQSAALVEELLYQEQIVSQLHTGVANYEHPLRSVMP